MPRRYGYIRASLDKQIASPETQRRLIEEYAARSGKRIDAFYVDPDSSGSKPLCDREAGARLMTDLDKDDELYVARLDRISRSFVDFARILSLFMDLNNKFVMCDMNQTFDPKNPMSKLLVGILILFASYERDMIIQRTKEGLASLRKQGRRFSRWPSYGYRFERRGTIPSGHRKGKALYVQVPDEAERTILVRCAELAEQVHSYDRIRQYLNYDWKVGTKAGTQFGLSTIPAMVREGKRLIEERKTKA
jgi:DNA invertase Pin-like site-specific DNA recombinase